MRKNGPMERYPGIDEDARNHIVPGSNTIDNSPRPKGVKRGEKIKEKVPPNSHYDKKNHRGH